MLAIFVICTAAWVAVDAVTDDWSGVYSGFLTDCVVFWILAVYLLKDWVPSGFERILVRSTAICDATLFLCWLYWTNWYAYLVILFPIRICAYILCEIAIYRLPKKQCL